MSLDDEITAPPFDHCLIAGAGAWGTALAVLLASAGRQVTLWTRNDEVAADIATRRTNSLYLPGVTIPEGVSVTQDPEGAADADCLLCVIPAQHAGMELPRFRAGARAADGFPVALCSKGIERSTGRMMHEVLNAVWPGAGASVLSGPSFAADVAHNLPTAVTLADSDPRRAARWVTTLATPSFRPYASTDVTGAEIGGAAKNVLAIACGVVEGRGLGESARAALIARGFAEILRFAAARGAQSGTLHGLSGLGDIILTCNSQQSRNFSLGVALGKGEKAGSLLTGRRTVAEGAATAGILRDMAAAGGTEMPVVAAVADLVAEQVGVDEVISRLMSRPLRAE